MLLSADPSGAHDPRFRLRLRRADARRRGARVHARGAALGPDPLQAQRRRSRAIARADERFSRLVGRDDAPVLIDQEGGRVQRMGPPHWQAYPAAARFDATSAPERAAWLAARLIAHDLREVGINVDCAPVLDVADPGMHAVIGTRAFSSAPERVAALGRAVCDGLIGGRRRAGRQAHSRPRPGESRQPSRTAGRRAPAATNWRRAISRPSWRCATRRWR